MACFRTDVPDTASEIFDGELVIAHYGSGLYYSISDTGAQIWQGLRHGLSVDETVGWLEGYFVAGTRNIAADVGAFVDRLAGEGLLVAVDQPHKGGDLPELAPGAWGEPLLERFDDLQELLVLDPVHDVSEAGWPHRSDD